MLIERNFVEKVVYYDTMIQNPANEFLPVIAKLLRETDRGITNYGAMLLGLSARGMQQWNIGRDDLVTVLVRGANACQPETVNSIRGIVAAATGPHAYDRIQEAKQILRRPDAITPHEAAQILLTAAAGSLVSFAYRADFMPLGLNYDKAEKILTYGVQSLIQQQKAS